jgi:hypothetical protein
LREGTEWAEGAPVIFGNHYLVPPLKIQLLHEITNKPIVGTEITLSYVWKYLEPPSPEHRFGAWEETSYSTDCYSNEEGAIEVAEFKLEPIGWYKGIHSALRKPTFLHVRVGYKLPSVRNREGGCYTYTEVTKSQLDECKRRGKCEFTIKDSCAGDWE